MNTRLRSRFAGLLIAGLLVLITAGETVAQASQTRTGKPLTIEEYDRWRSIASASLSDDGRWVSYIYRQRNEPDELYFHDIQADTVHEVLRGSAPRFSPDSRWVTYNLAAGEDGDTARLVLRSLDTGDTVSWRNVRDGEFSAGSDVLVLRKRPTDSRDDDAGTDILIRYLRSGTEELIGSVGSHAFNQAGDLLAYAVHTADGVGNGLHLLELPDGGRRVLDHSRLTYSRLTWHDDGAMLAVLRGHVPEGVTERENSLVVFSRLDRGQAQRRDYGPGDVEGLPEGMVISQRGTLRFSDDGHRLFLHLKDQEPTAEELSRGDRRADVHVFHWADDRIQTVQQRRASADRNRTDRGVLHLEDRRMVRLTDPEMSGIQLSDAGRWAVGSDSRAYVSDWKESRADYYRVDTETGARDLFLQEQGRTLGLSPDGRFFLFWRDAHIWSYDLENGRELNLTRDAPVSFENAEFDRFGTAPPYGIAGWTSDKRSVILNHRYDLWLQPLDGGPATNLTDGFGAENEIRLRYVRLDRDERLIDISRPLFLSAYGEWTKKAGYFQLHRGRLTELIYLDRRFGNLRKAPGADRLLFTMETFRDFPDYYISDARFSSPRRLTDANPQQAEYRWGHRILFDYENKDGVRLQGTLGIPDGYVAGERLPMLVNYYEKNSHNLHRYPAPRHASRPDLAGFLSHGYLVMQPDIHFNTGTTHSDMLDCVEAAVRKVIELGYADPARIGLHGHSFSGGGSAYIGTQSDMFAAIVAGAGPINLVSEFNQLFRGSGQNNHRYDIHGQGRYGTNPYDDFELYWSQSPIAHVRTMDTPMLYLHGEEDATVEYLQAMEWYNALRFNGKPIIFLSYPGEGHSLSRIENRIDFQVRVSQFFDHHLKGQPAPVWMTKGVPYLERDRHAITVTRDGEVIVPEPDDVTAGRGGGR